MKVLSLLTLPQKAVSGFTNWATKPLVLEEKKDFKRITEYGLWRCVTLWFKDLEVYEGLTDKKHIVIYEGNKLNFDEKKDEAFRIFKNAVACTIYGNRNLINQTNSCLNDRFPQKPSNTLLLIEGLERTSPWLVKFIEKGGRVWKLPTFQDGAIELLTKGVISENDIRNLLITTAAYHIQSSKIESFYPPLVQTDVHLQEIDEVVDLVSTWADKQYLRAYYFRDLLDLSEIKYKGSSNYSLDEAKKTYTKILERANLLRSKKIREAMNDGASSLLILTDRDHRDTIVSNETLEKMDAYPGKVLNGEAYKGHNLVTRLMPNYKFVDIVSNL